MTIVRPRSRFLTHRYPMWQGCSMKELMFVISGLVLFFVAVSLVLSGFVGHFSLFILFFTVCLYPAGVFSIKAFARYKKGKPQNFVMQDLARRVGIGKKHRLTRVGVWQTRRVIKNSAQGE